jgi:hypothetical protein
MLYCNHRFYAFSVKFPGSLRKGRDFTVVIVHTQMTCVAALVPDKKPTPPMAVSGTEDKQADSCFCEDDKNNKATKLKEREVAAQIHFEDSLHNLLYIKR